jgi:hypothetical protein
MKKVIILLLFVIFSLSVFSQKLTAPVINTAFKPGEYLKYKVKYGLISGGNAEMKIGLEQVGYDWYFRVKAIASTSGLAKSVANVKDRYESVIEIGTGYPLQAIRDINENSYRRYNEVIFVRDSTSNKAISLKSGEHKVPKGTLDILSAFYYARSAIFKNKLHKNDVITLTTFFDDELFPIKIKYLKTEKVRTKFGRIKCLKFVPILEKNSPFKKEDDMKIWFSDDGNFIPVKIRVKIGFGNIKCDLREYKDLKYPLGKPFNH